MLLLLCISLMLHSEGDAPMMSDIPGFHRGRWSDLWEIGLPLLVSAVCMKLECNTVIPLPRCAKRVLQDVQVFAESLL